ncbi:MAG TPA: fibronectin type III domain-containing protein [Candidatus Methylomirabilis sp.]|nr:fibronectin type III domain-containing protein [Candidatus Methylomirabilis sp.]
MFVKKDFFGKLKITSICASVAVLVFAWIFLSCPAIRNYSAVSLTAKAALALTESISGLTQSDYMNGAQLENNAWASYGISLYATSSEASGIIIYYQVAGANDTFITATTTPVNACSNGTSWDNCTSRVWYNSKTKISLALPESATGYKWQVLGCNETGCSKTWTTFNDSIPNFKIDNTAPSAPTGLTATNLSPNSVGLIWNVATDNNAVIGYDIARNTHSGGFLMIGTSPSNGYTDTGLLPSTKYYYSVRARDVAGNLNYSTEISKCTMPLQPAPLTVTAVSNSSIKFSFNGDNGNPAGLVYAVRVGSLYVQSNGSLGTAKAFKTQSCWGASKTVTGLAANTTYDFSTEAVASCSLATYSDWSPIASATTFAN